MYIINDNQENSKQTDIINHTKLSAVSEFHLTLIKNTVCMLHHSNKHYYQIKFSFNAAWNPSMTDATLYQ